MHYFVNTVEEYLNQIPEERKSAMIQLRNTILENIPFGFEEGINYGMIGYYVPHSIYPHGYHCKPKDPLPFINIASQKNFIAFYHMGFYSNPTLLNWFIHEFSKFSNKKLDMGKSCIRFKKINEIPYELIGQLLTKISVQDWISTYELNLKAKSK
jgi:uncharacterized protein YdhG (YjbR/CyaY superfamily)